MKIEIKDCFIKWVSGTQKKAGATNSWVYQTKTFNRTMNHLAVYKLRPNVFRKHLLSWISGKERASTTHFRVSLGWPSLKALD